MTAGALKGYRILDLGDEAGGFGMKVLADLGAEVIKVEPPTGGRERCLPPIVKTAAGAEGSAYFAYANSNKLGITLDLESSQGQALFRRLAKRVDAVFETFPPGYLAERGIGYEQMRELNPKLVWVSLTPFGQSGPRRDWKGSDLVAWASSAVLYTNGFPDSPPVAPASSQMLAYKLCGVNVAFGCLAALRARKKTGSGQLVDISMQEVTNTIMGEAPVTGFLDDLRPRVRNGNRRVVSVPWGIFPCKDGHIQLVVVQPGHWKRLAQWIAEKTGNDAVVDPLFEDFHQRIQNREAIESWIEELTMLYGKQEFFEEGQRRGIPASSLNSVTDLSKDPQLAARQYWTQVDDTVFGRVSIAGAPYRMSETPWQTGRAPTLGEHNNEIYGDQLGISSEEQAALKAQGII